MEQVEQSGDELIQPHLGVEEWRPVVGFEGLYEISNLGNVKGIDKYVFGKNKTPRKLREYNRKLVISDMGYYIVMLYKENKHKVCRVHRLIAKAFIPNPNNYKYINHKDGNKLNNSISNLEWCTMAHNNKHAYDIGLKKPTMLGRTGEKSPFSIPVIQMGLNGSFIKEFSGITEASRIVGISQSMVSLSCMRKYKPKRGFIWIKKSNYGFE